MSRSFIIDTYSDYSDQRNLPSTQESITITSGTNDQLIFTASLASDNTPHYFTGRIEDGIYTDMSALSFSILNAINDATSEEDITFSNYLTAPELSPTVEYTTNFVITFYGLEDSSDIIIDFENNSNTVATALSLRFPPTNITRSATFDSEISAWVSSISSNEFNLNHDPVDLPFSYNQNNVFTIRQTSQPYKLIQGK